MVKATTAAAFIVPKAEFLLEFAIVTLDTPAELRHIDQPVEADIGSQCGKPVFQRLVLICGPFDQQPFLRPGFGRIVIAMGRLNPPPGKARGQFSIHL